jgi:NADP-dependent 3-hydroxy acid dehydrogenase YdfG
VCAVVGASSGIGAALGETLASEGARVVGFARRFAQEARQPERPGDRYEAKLDVRDREAVAAAFAALPELELLLLAMGGGSFASFEELAPDDLRDMFETHVVGTLHCCQAALPGMIRRGRGRIVSIGSLTQRQSFAECAGYAAAKAAQSALLRDFSSEYRARGVAVTQVIAGAVHTPLWHGREGFHSADMLRPQEFARALVPALRPSAAVVDEIAITPPKGVL